jgi:hypothetical protein
MWTMENYMKLAKKEENKIFSFANGGEAKFLLC